MYFRYSTTNFQFITTFNVREIRKMKKIKLIEIHSELGAGTRGAGLGPSAIKVASLNKKSNLFGSYDLVEVPNENEVMFSLDKSSSNSPYAKWVDEVTANCQRICDTISQTLQDGEMPVIISGDHSSAAGIIAGVKKHYKNERVGILWIDAHADLHSPYTTPSGNMHGMPLGASLGLDKLGKELSNSPANNVDSTLEKKWSDFKQLGGISPKFDPENLVFIGIRDLEIEEKRLINHLNINVIDIDELRKNGAKEVVKTTEKLFANCDKVFISFDVDSLDSQQVSSGTGTPVPDGINLEEAKILVNNLLAMDKVCAFEITEVNPTLDNKINYMAEVAFDLLETSVKAINNRKQEVMLNG